MISHNSYGQENPKIELLARESTATFPNHWMECLSKRKRLICENGAIYTTNHGANAVPGFCADRWSTLPLWSEKEKSHFLAFKTHLNFDLL